MVAFTLNNKIIIYYLIVIVINTHNMLHNMDNSLFFLSAENSQSIVSIETDDDCERWHSHESQVHLDTNISINGNTYMWPLGKYGKFKRWVYWKTVGSYNQEFSSYNDCKLRWNPHNYSLRQGFKKEYIEFKDSPLNYLQKEREYFKMRGRQDAYNISSGIWTKRKWY
jgi:hypothetical protein